MLIVANWKAYVQSEEKAKKLFAVAKRLSSSTKDISLVLAPPAPYLGLLSSGNRSKVAFSAQDISAGIGGAATGEIISGLLADLNVQYSIIGHSERRAMGETNEMVSEKVRHALANKIIPIVCVGEKTRDPEARYLTFLRTEIQSIFETLSSKERSQVILAYEPIWAIGKTAAESIAPTDLTEMVLYIRKILTQYLPGKAATKVKILYGGSVEPGNARMLAGGTQIDGFLLGHASADPEMFSQIVKAVT